MAGGLGYAPIAPGTAGSLGGVLVFLGIVVWAESVGPGGGLGGEGGGGGEGLSRPVFMALYAGLVAGLFGLGVWAAGWAEEGFGRSDDGRIVIDEVVGQLATLSPLTLITAEADFFWLGLGVVTGFVLFRVFDIWKPGAIGWTERRFAGGLGVMMDDVVAGVYGATGLLALGWLLGGVLGRGPL